MSRNYERMLASFDHTIEDLQRARANLAASLDNLHQAKPGVRSVPTDGGGHAQTDPTMSMLNQCAARANDNAIKAREALDQLTREVQAKARTIDRITQTWATGGRPVKEAVDIWCENCAKHGCTEPDRTRNVGTLKVCRWCAEKNKQHGKLPGHAQCNARARGERERVAA
jgi:hypothetical protein